MRVACQAAVDQAVQWDREDVALLVELTEAESTCVRIELAIGGTAVRVGERRFGEHLDTKRGYA